MHAKHVIVAAGLLAVAVLAMPTGTDEYIEMTDYMLSKGFDGVEAQMAEQMLKLVDPDGLADMNYLKNLAVVMKNFAADDTIESRIKFMQWLSEDLGKLHIATVRGQLYFWTLVGMLLSMFLMSCLCACCARCCQRKKDSF